MAASGTSSAGDAKLNNTSEPSCDAKGENEHFPGFKDVDAFVKHGLGAVVAATKASSALPQPGDEFDFYRSFPGFRHFCASQGDKLLHCMSQIMQYHGCMSHMRVCNKLTGLEDQFDRVADSNDVILEKVDILLDEASGVNRSQEPVMPAGYQPPKIVVSSWNRKGDGSAYKSETFRLLHARNIQRPQLQFKDKVDNSNTPFISKIFVKPNAQMPLPSYFTNKHTRNERPEDLDVPAALADFIHQQRTQEHKDDMFSHPYQYELDHLTLPEILTVRCEPQMFKPLSDTSCLFVNTLEDLVALNEKLARTTEFAVDLEHHSYRSFLGITCLMQISTRDEDFIVDTLVLRSEMYILNETFTDPNIVKVFHGADADIEWLQKDFGLYVVNMFDTHQASRMLNLGRNSLDHLLKVFCDITSDKRYQLADWRIRPLPDEMFQYAQADTHYLLYIYDRLRADLLDMGHGNPGLIQSVWLKSRDICLKKYVKPIFTEQSYLEMYKKQKKPFHTQQLSAFRLLFAWRDKLARREDESTGYVLPNHMMLKISEELPKEPQGIIACCNPTPPLVRQQINELNLLVKEARQVPLLKSEVLDEQKKSVTPKRKPDSSLFGPHDASHVSETDLSFQETPTKSGVLFPDEVEELVPLVATAKVKLFEDWKEDSSTLTVAQKKAHSIMESFENPFRMYLPSKDIHISKTAKYDPSSKIYEISNRWKLLSAEQQQQEAKERKKDKEQTKKAAEERKKAERTYKEALQDVITVRQEAAEAGQHRKKRERVVSEVGEQAPQPDLKVQKTSGGPADVHMASSSSKKPMKLAEKSKNPDLAQPTTFTPFDYSQSSLKVFSGAKVKDAAQFDPNRQVHVLRKKNPKGQKQSSQTRSMSYTAAKSERGFYRTWPKR
ncbi:exosome complex component 10 [Denticeps clupeoides]|uniref:Exosome complex component 10 n=2 Tax=Denticeps clupeoides TaxID=299321 RepID=A0AAY4BPJ5_9TELE|nr:exosome component 10 [Denticeps clupeoides]